MARAGRDGHFLLTPAQHLKRAEELEQSNPWLAKHHQLLAQAIAWRQGITIESPRSLRMPDLSDNLQAVPPRPIVLCVEAVKISRGRESDEPDVACRLHQARRRCLQPLLFHDGLDE